MALEMRAQGKAVRFEYHDDDASTVVALSPEDSQEALVRKLKRVIALVEGSAQAPAYPDDVREFLGPQRAVGRPVKTLEPPVLPDRLKGDVELMGTSGVAEVSYDQTPGAGRAASGHEGAAPQPGNGWASLGGEG